MFAWGQFPLLGCTPKGAYSTRGRSRHLLETAFSEPLLRTLLRTLFYCKTHSRPPSQNPSENPSPEPCPEPSQNPSQNAVLPYAPLGVHPTCIFLGQLKGPDAVNFQRVGVGLHKIGCAINWWEDLHIPWRPAGLHKWFPTGSAASPSWEATLGYQGNKQGSKFYELSADLKCKAAWVHAACADCSSFLALGAAGFPVPSFLKDPQIMSLD